METLTLNPPTDMAALLEKYCKDCELRNMTEGGIRRYKTSIKQYISYFDGVNLFNPNMQMLIEYLDYLRNERKVKPVTIENNFSGLSSFYEYLIFMEFSDKNLIPTFRKRYLRMYKKDRKPSERKRITVEEMSRLVNVIFDPRDKALVVILIKTGIRRGESLNIDVDEIDWTNYSIMLKPHAKRTNCMVFFDDECAIVLKRWLKVREKLNPTTKALFISYQTNNRLCRNGAYRAVVKYAKMLGFYDSDSNRLEDHLSPHCFRHWFTTNLLRNGMPREYVAELRGDRKKEAVDIYNHIDMEDLRKSYLTHIPKLGI